MLIKPLKLEGVFEIVPQLFSDERGYFSTLYERGEFASAGLITAWTGDNQSFNHLRGTFRGLHFQKPPSSQTKLVRAVVGRALDIFVDLRPDSPTFMQWDSIELDGEICNGVLVPKGFAHGYLTLTDGCIISYKVDAPYDREREGGCRIDDPAFRIRLPYTGSMTISAKDRGWPDFQLDASPFVETGS